MQNQNEKIELNIGTETEKAFLILETEAEKYDYDKGKMRLTPVFSVPCGETFEKVRTVYTYMEKENEEPKTTTEPETPEHLIETHCKTCNVCKIVSGFSKQTTLPQNDIAQLFGLGFDGFKSGTNNFHSNKGILTHYRTIEAIRTMSKDIISNRQCFGGGFAKCSKPKNVNYRLDLTTLQQFGIWEQDMRNIEVLDSQSTTQEKDSWNQNVLFTLPNPKVGEANEYSYRYFLNGFDGNARYIAELLKPVHNVKEAFQSMIPETVKDALTQGLTVQRQGELFFIPVSEQFGKIKPLQIQKRKKIQCVKVVYRCTKCGIETKPETFDISEPINEALIQDRLNQTPNHPTIFYHCWQTDRNPELKKREDCPNRLTDKDMERIETVTYRFERFPTIPNHETHSVTELAIVNSETLVRGIVRHVSHDHAPLNLGKNWFVVVQNTVLRAISVQRGDKD